MAVEFELCADLVPEKDSPESQILRFQEEPTTFGEIKEKVEETCSVPSCVQTILYQNSEIADTTTPQSLYLRSGDHIQVSFPAKGLVKEVKEALNWIQKCDKILSDYKINIESGGLASISDESVDVLKDIVAPELLQTKLFSSWSLPGTSVNATHFDYLGGFQQLVDFHKLVITMREDAIFRQHNINSYFYEYLFCRAIANFCMNNSFSLRASQCGGLDTCIESFLLKPADDNSLRLNNTYAVLGVALRGIFNIAEIPDVQLELSFRHDVINQGFLAANSSIYSSYSMARWIISVLLCISRTPESHVNLLKTELVEKLLQLQVSHSHRDHSNSDEVEQVAIMTYSGVILAQAILGSSDLLLDLPSSLQDQIALLMETVRQVNPKLIHEYEENNGFYWGTFISCLDYLYKPQFKFHALHLLSTEVLLQYLISSMGRSIHIEIVVSETLLDYIIILPWILDDKVRGRAMTISTEIGKFHQIQPPSLACIAKAHLAKYKWGLKKLLTLYSITELCSM